MWYPFSVAVKHHILVCREGKRGAVIEDKYKIWYNNSNIWAI